MKDQPDRHAALAEAMAGEPALWSGRPALGALILSALPLFLFVLLFWATALAFGAWDGPHRLRLRTPIGIEWIALTKPGAVLGVRLVLAGLMALSLYAVARPLWVWRRTCWRLTGRALIQDMGRARLVWPLAEIVQVTVEPFSLWRRFVFETPGRGGPRDLLIGQAEALRLVDVLRGAGVDCEGAVDTVSATGLAADERTAWQGRPGLGSFDAMRGISVIAGALPMLAFGLWLWRIWARAESVAMALFWSAFALLCGGMTALAIVMSFHATAMQWLLDLFGRVAITQRRIVWIAPLTGRVYREIALGEIIMAELIEAAAGRGWISLTLTRDREQELRGLPEPEATLAAIRKALATGPSAGRQG